MQLTDGGLRDTVGRAGRVAVDRVGREDSGSDEADAHRRDQDRRPATGAPRRNPAAYAVTKSPETTKVAACTQRDGWPSASELTGWRSGS